MFLFRFSRRAGQSLPQASLTADSPGASVPGFDYFDAAADRPREAPQASLSPERAALDQAFGYWSEN